MSDREQSVIVLGLQIGLQLSSPNMYARTHHAHMYTHARTQTNKRTHNPPGNHEGSLQKRISNTSLRIPINMVHSTDSSVSSPDVFFRGLLSVVSSSPG